MAIDTAPADVGWAQFFARSRTRVRRSSGQYGIIFWLGTAWIVLVTGAAILAPFLPIPDPAAIDPVNRLQGVGAPDHVLGTDALGRDVLSRLVYGGRVSLLVAVSSALIGLIVGATLGTLAGFFGGLVETLIMWVMDVLLSFPSLVLLICVVTFVGRNVWSISFAMALLTVPTYARLSRVHAKTVSEREFVLAGRALGVRVPRLLVRDVLPNILPPVLSYGLITMGLVIVAEGSLSFLGLSVSVPTASWGGLIAAGQSLMRSDPGQVLLPSAALCLTVLSLNLVGDTLRRRHEIGVK
jgi:peptide/nickel transport system permease protein